MVKHKVISTKILDKASVEQASKNNIDIIQQEFISIRPVWNEETFKSILNFAEKKVSHIAFTSAHAVTILDRYMHAGDTYYVIDWKMFSLSGKTKEAILEAKRLQKNIIGEAKNAKELAQEIIASGINEIIFFCGNKRRDELPETLKAAGVKVHEVILYETVETPTITTDDAEAVLFFSPSAVQSFFSVNQLKADTVCFALGDTTAASIADFTDNPVIVAESASQEMMLRQLVFYFEHKDCYESGRK